MPRKRKDQPIDPTANATSRRALIAAIAAALITAIGGIAVAIINGWFKPDATPESGIYRLRVTVVGDKGIPIEDAKVWSTFGGEPKKVEGGWQFDIPAASKPKAGKLTVFASKESAFLTGKESLILEKEMNPPVTIKLQRDTTAKVRGQVVNQRNQAIEGARVCIAGYESEAVITKKGGNFELPAHAAIGQPALLHAEVSGYPAVKLWHQAGEKPAILMLQK